MRNILAIAGREFRAYLESPVGWLVLAGFLLITGFFFASMASYYSAQAAQLGLGMGEDVNVDEYLVAPFFSNVGVILLMLVPAISMRLFAEDRRSGAFELLLTSPVSTTEIVLGKYLGGLAFAGVMLLATLHYPAVLFWLGEPDPGVVAMSYLATFLMVASFLAVGLLTSAFTENQVVALVLGFVLLLLFWVASWADASASSSRWSELLSYVSMLSHMEQLGKGIVHLKDLVYYLTFIALALFATHQRVEGFRWR